LLITGIPSKELEEELKSCYSEEEHRKTIAEDCEFARRYDLTDHYQSLRGLLFLVGLTMNFDYAEFVSNAFINTSGLEPYCNQFEANFGLKDRLESGTFAPTYALDARDPQLMRHVEEAYNRGVRVFKIYPSLGYAVSDLRLYPFYEWAEKTQVNIISHSGIGGFENPLLSKIDNVWNDDKKQYEDKQFRSILPWNWFAPEKKAWFNHPKNWIPVLAKFPYLRLDLAHNGGYEHLPGYAKALMNKSRIPKDNATAAIVELCRQYDNVVTDFSYTGYGDKIYDHLLTIFQNPETRDMQYKTCFGTDNDLVLMEMDLFKYVKRFFHFWNAAGNNEYKAYFKNISRDNAARWLNGEELNP
jgi:predicted TIM-barrel fold metal-dependent hydrolase